MFNFFADPGPEHDKDNFIAKVQRRDIAVLGTVNSSSSLKTSLIKDCYWIALPKVLGLTIRSGKMKMNFYTTKPRSVQGFNVGK